MLLVMLLVSIKVSNPIYFVLIPILPPVKTIFHFVNWLDPKSTNIGPTSQGCANAHILHRRANLAEENAN